jgi:hypothetical protein
MVNLRIKIRAEKGLGSDREGSPDDFKQAQFKSIAAFSPDAEIRKDKEAGVSLRW